MLRKHYSDIRRNDRISFYRGQYLRKRFEVSGFNGKQLTLLDLDTERDLILPRGSQTRIITPTIYIVHRGARTRTRGHIEIEIDECFRYEIIRHNKAQSNRSVQSLSNIP